MPKTVRASIYKNKKEEKGLQVSMPFEVAEKAASGDKEARKAILDAVKSAVK